MHAPTPFHEYMSQVPRKLFLTTCWDSQGGEHCGTLFVPRQWKGGASWSILLISQHSVCFVCIEHWYLYGYIYICIHGIMRFTHNYPQISIRYQISTAAWTRASGMLWLMVSTKKLSRSMGDEASPERWLEVPKALRLFRYTLRIG